jgi:L-ribulose-5-phosphate 3-epimerase
MNRRELLKGLPALAAASAVPLRAGGDTEKLAGIARLRTAICAYSYREALKNKTMTYGDLVHLAVEQGVDGMDTTVYWFPDTSDEFLLPLRRLAYRNAVEIYSIAISTDMCRPPNESRGQEVEKVKGWVDAAEKLGAGHIRVFGGRIPKGSNEEEAASWAAETLKWCADYSAKKGIILGLENHGGITERAETVVKIVKMVDSPWVGINVDTGNFNTDGYAQIQTCIPYAVNVQLKTDIRVEGGKREPEDWDRVMGMLAKGGYKGYVALEYEAREDPAIAVPRLMKDIRRLAQKYNTV